MNVFRDIDSQGWEMLWVEVKAVAALTNLNLRVSGIFRRQVDFIPISLSQAETGIKDREAQFLQSLSYQTNVEFSSCLSG